MSRTCINVSARVGNLNQFDKTIESSLLGRDRGYKSHRHTARQSCERRRGINHDACFLRAARTLGVSQLLLDARPGVPSGAGDLCLAADAP